MGVLEQGERSRAVYEDLPGYVKPPVVPVRGFSDPEFFWPLDVGPSGPARSVANLLARLSGYARFMRALPDSLEERLRSTNLRLPVLYSPVVSATAALQEDPRTPGPFLRAATLVAAARSFHDDLRSGTLPQDMSRGLPQEMGQYANLFGTSVVVDRGPVRVFKTLDVDHLLVVLRGRMFIVEIGKGGEVSSAARLAQTLSALWEEEAGGNASVTRSPGVLTFASDRTQRTAFRKLAVSPVNRLSLEKMRHTFLTLSLDLESAPADSGEAARVAHSGNSFNRWFHSSLQIVVFGNGQACAIFNFTTYLDGNIMVRAASEFQRRAAECPLEGGHVGGRMAADVRPLTFDILAALVRRAEEDARRIRDDQQATFAIEGIGRQAFSHSGVSPVQAFVVALELAARRLIGCTVNIEQFITMSGFRCMDLVAPNVATPSLVAFVERVVTGQMNGTEAGAEVKRVCGELEAYTESARRYLPMDTAVALFLESRGPLGKMGLFLLNPLLALLLASSGRLKKLRRQIVISHPVTSSSVPVLGRPGVKLPYAEYFGLHYQMFAERTVVTVMPGVTWHTSNKALVEALQEELQRLLRFLHAGAEQGHPVAAEPRLCPPLVAEAMAQGLPASESGE